MDFRFAGGLVGGYKLSYFEFIMLIAELDEVSTAILGGEAAENIPLQPLAARLFASAASGWLGVAARNHNSPGAQ